MKLTNVHLAVSAFAALAGVLLAGIQTFGSGGFGPSPVTVTLAVDPATLGKEVGAGMVVPKDGEPGSINASAKADGGMPLQTYPTHAGRALDLTKGARFYSAMKEAPAQPYAFQDLFDGRPDTSLSLNGSDTELNLIVDFGTQTAIPVTEIAYSPAVISEGMTAATILDVMVLPEGQIGASGGQVMSYALQTEQGRQTFLLPAGSRGKGLWLRIAGPGTTKLAIGDFQVLTE